MCPVCIATAAVIAAKAGSTGGAAVCVANKFRKKTVLKPAEASGQVELGKTKEGKMHPKITSHTEWIAARKEFLKKEKEFTRLRDELSRERRELPCERVEKDYVFDGPKGRETLASLFDGRSQLVIYHFMFGPEWEQGCPSCSLVSDTFNGNFIHLAQRDVTFVAVSRAPIERIEAFQKRMGWSFRWVSSLASDFNFDYQVSLEPGESKTGKHYYNYDLTEFPSEERPGLSVFTKNAAGELFHTYSAYARGLDLLIGVYNILDMTPKGRDEGALSPPMAWVRHHDRYADKAVVSTIGQASTLRATS